MDYLFEEFNSAWKEVNLNFSELNDDYIPLKKIE